MHQMPCQLGQAHDEPTNLSVFPLDHSAIQRLAITLTPEQLTQNRLTAVTVITALFEPLSEEIDKMERLASSMDPIPQDLVRDIRKMREAACHLQLVLDESSRPV